MNLIKIFESHSHWQQVVAILQKLSAHGHLSYLAGGCVRDALLSQLPHDFDIATTATPDEVKILFPTSLEVGREFGVMVVPYKGFSVEIATFRKDREYLDGRRPEGIAFSNPKEDSLRRDFTVNALFYDITEDKVLDYVGGISDIKKKIIRAVGDPVQRFKEDKLRLIRAARFSGQLNFDIDAETVKAMKQLSTEVGIVSKERITSELKKISQSLAPEKSLDILRATGLLAQIWSDFQFFNNNRLWMSFVGVCQVSARVKSFELLIAYFLIFEIIHSAKVDLDLRVQNLYLAISNQCKRRIDFLVSGFFHFANREAPNFIEKALILLDHDEGPLLSELCYNLSLFKMIPRDNIVDAISQFLLLSDGKGHLPRPYLNGDDIISLGLTPSPLVGKVLSQMYYSQLRGEILSREEALIWVKAKINN